MSLALVLDASVVVKWFLPEAGSQEAAQLLRQGADLLAPDLLLAEVASAIWKRYMRDELTLAEARAMAKDIGAVAVETVPARGLLVDALPLSAALRHSVYDCLYLALAMRLELQMVTADRALLAKARAHPELRRWLRPLMEEPHA
jgi:predicted nucleic acid-binding protein